jgi:probable F420-dependent oxidoreductase
MKFGIVPPFYAGVGGDSDWMADFARHAEDCGFDEIVAIEHAVVVSGYESRYPYAASGRMPLADDCPIPDPLDLLSFLAACTSRIGLATGVLVLPLHHPVVLAKRVATLDRLSKGRLRLGIGTGWMREEIEACGVDPDVRGRLTDEAIDVMRSLWTADGDGATFEGEFFTVARAHSHPKPWRDDGVPLHIGGHTVAAARRAGRRGDGLQPLVFDPTEVKRLVDVMGAEAERAGRDPSALELTLSGSLKRTTPEAVAEAESLGACRMVLSPKPRADLHEVKDELSAFAERIELGR